MGGTWITTGACEQNSSRGRPGLAAYQPQAHRLLSFICNPLPKRHDPSPLSTKSRGRIAGIQQSIFWRLDFVHRYSVSSTSTPRIAAIYMQSVPQGPRSLAPVDKIEGTDCWIAGSSEEGENLLLLLKIQQSNNPFPRFCRQARGIVGLGGRIACK